MGRIRARTAEEIEERRNEILQAAEDLLSEEEYEDITLGTIAEKTSVSRPSMYTYYKTKEEVIVDLMIREYQLWELDLKKKYTRKMTRERFCRTMVNLLWQRNLLLKLLSLHVTALRNKCSDELIIRFEKEVQPFFITLSGILKKQFPLATEAERSMFSIQFTVYCNSLYALRQIPDIQREAMRDFDLFGTIPDDKEICYEGLMLLSSALALNKNI